MDLPCILCTRSTSFFFVFPADKFHSLRIQTRRGDCGRPAGMIVDSWCCFSLAIPKGKAAVDRSVNGWTLLPQCWSNCQVNLFVEFRKAASEGSTFSKRGKKKLHFFSPHFLTWKCCLKFTSLKCISVWLYCRVAPSSALLRSPSSESASFAPKRQIAEWNVKMSRSLNLTQTPLSMQDSLSLLPRIFIEYKLLLGSSRAKATLKIIQTFLVGVRGWLDNTVPLGYCDNFA